MDIEEDKCMNTGTDLSTLVRNIQKPWSVLTDPSNYRVPEQLEDYRRLGWFPLLRLGQVDLFALEPARAAIIACACQVQQFVGPQLFSLDTVVDAITEELRSLFLSPEPRKLLDSVQNIEASIRSTNHPRRYVRAISGLVLDQIDEINHGRWRLLCLAGHLIEEFVSRDPGDEAWKGSVRGFLAERLANQTCIVIETDGDAHKARQNCVSLARSIVNSLRYIASVHLAPIQRTYDVRIRLDYFSGRRGAVAFEQTLDTHESTILGSETRSRQPYTLTPESLRLFKTDWHLEGLWSLLEAIDRTQLDESIATALNWFGDAQDEDDLNVSYVKYWTALEALVTAHSRGSISARLSAVIPVMVRLTTGVDIQAKAVRNAYDLRSAIVHGDPHKLAQRADVERTNSWVTQCIALCLHLRSLNFRTTAEVEERVAGATHKVKPAHS